MASVSKRTWTYKGEAKAAWVVRYVDGDGKRRQETFEHKKTADRRRLEIQMEIERGEHVPAAEATTVARLTDYFMRHNEDRVRDGRITKGTFAALRTAVRCSIVPYIGARRASDLELSDIEEFYRTLCRKGRLKPSVARARLQVFKQVEDYAVKRKLMKRRPVSDALRELRGVSQEPIRTFTEAQIGALIEAARVRRVGVMQRSHFMENCFLHLAVFCGMRIGEIQGLTRPCLDLKARLIRVRRSYSLHDGLKVPKTRSSLRDIPVPPHVAAMLERWCATCVIANDLDLVFTTTCGTPLTTTHFHREHWRPLLKAAGLNEGERFHFHALRHFAASWMIHNGVSPVEVASLLGHKTFDMTLQVYAHAIANGHQRHETSDRLAAALLPVPALMGDRVDMCTAAEVAAGMDLSKEAVANKVRDLAAAGLLNVERDDRDRIMRFDARQFGEICARSGWPSRAPQISEMAALGAARATRSEHANLSA